MYDLKIYFASSNDHKKQEMMRLLNGVNIMLPKEEAIAFDPVEDGNSFIENALIKAKDLYKKVNAPVLADDSGLVVDALDGRPGIHTSRYGDVDGKKLIQSEKNAKLLGEMEGKENRRARFVCALVLMVSNEKIYIIQETVEGYIAHSIRGEHGFGYDPLFLVEETGKSAAELSDSEKDKYSHRGRAVRKMNLIIEKLKEELKWREVNKS